MKNRTRVSYIDRIIIWCLTHIKRINHIIQVGTGEAYDLGFKRGLESGMGIAKGKKYKNKVKKALKGSYKIRKNN